MRWISAEAAHNQLHIYAPVNRLYWSLCFHLSLLLLLMAVRVKEGLVCL